MFWQSTLQQLLSNPIDRPCKVLGDSSFLSRMGSSPLYRLLLCPPPVNIDLLFSCSIMGGNLLWDTNIRCVETGWNRHVKGWCENMCESMCGNMGGNCLKKTVGCLKTVWKFRAVKMPQTHYKIPQKKKARKLHPRARKIHPCLTHPFCMGDQKLPPKCSGKFPGRFTEKSTQGPENSTQVSTQGSKDHMFKWSG